MTVAECSIEPGIQKIWCPDCNDYWSRKAVGGRRPARCPDHKKDWLTAVQGDRTQAARRRNITHGMPDDVEELSPMAVGETRQAKIPAEKGDDVVRTVKILSRVAIVACIASLHGARVDMRLVTVQVEGEKGTRRIAAERVLPKE